MDESDILNLVTKYIESNNAEDLDKENLMNIVRIPNLDISVCKNIFFCKLTIFYRLYVTFLKQILSFQLKDT